MDERVALADLRPTRMSGPQLEASSRRKDFPLPGRLCGPGSNRAPMHPAPRSGRWEPRRRRACAAGHEGASERRRLGLCVACDVPAERFEHAEENKNRPIKSTIVTLRWANKSAQRQNVTVFLGWVEPPARCGPLAARDL